MYISYRSKIFIVRRRFVNVISSMKEQTIIKYLYIRLPIEGLRCATPSSLRLPPFPQTLHDISFVFLPSTQFLPTKRTKAQNGMAVGFVRVHGGVRQFHPARRRGFEGAARKCSLNPMWPFCPMPQAQVGFAAFRTLRTWRGPSCPAIDTESAARVPVSNSLGTLCSSYSSNCNTVALRPAPAKVFPRTIATCVQRQRRVRWGI